MVAQPIYAYHTPDEYFGLDAENDHPRLEYDRGLVYAMAGASDDHNSIASQVNGWFILNVQNKPCRSFQSDTKVGLSNESYFYPDVLAVCGKRDYEDRGKGVLVLLNPEVIVEVTSSSTQALDRGRKYEVYTAMPSVKHYLIVDQDRLHITHHARTTDGWMAREYTSLTEAIPLDWLGTMPVAWVYAKASWMEGEDNV